MPKPPNRSKADKVKVAACPQGEVLQTPVMSEALMSLQNLIIKRDAHALDEKGKQNLLRHMQKFVKAAQIFLARDALNKRRIQFLIKLTTKPKFDGRPSQKYWRRGRGK